MLIRGISIQGMAGMADVELTQLGRVVQVAGPPRARQALADALRLALGAWTPEGCAAAWSALGSPAEVKGRGLPLEIHLQRPERITPLLAREGDRTLRVRLDLELDPPQFGRLREQAIRRPELVDALSGGALLSLGLGWVFTKDHSVVALSLHRPRLGRVELDLEGDWLAPLLADLAERGRVLARRRPDRNAIAAADRSADPSRRRALGQLRQALKRPPFQLDELHIVQEADRPRWLAFGPDLVPARALGRAAREELALATAVFLDPAEILVADKPCARSERPRAMRNWLARQAEEEASPLEQVWMLGVGSDHQVGARRASSERGLRFPVRRVR